MTVYVKHSCGTLAGGFYLYPLCAEAVSLFH